MEWVNIILRFDVSKRLPFMLLHEHSLARPSESKVSKCKPYRQHTIITFSRSLNFYRPSNTVPFDLFIKHVMYSMGDEFSSFMQSQAHTQSAHRPNKNEQCNSGNKEQVLSPTPLYPLKQQQEKKLSQQMTISSFGSYYEPDKRKADFAQFLTEFQDIKKRQELFR